MGGAADDAALEPDGAGCPFLVASLREDRDALIELETAHSLGMSLRRWLGWEPSTTTRVTERDEHGRPSAWVSTLPFALGGRVKNSQANPV